MTAVWEPEGPTCRAVQLVAAETCLAGHAEYPRDPLVVTVQTALSGPMPGAHGRPLASRTGRPLAGRTGRPSEGRPPCRFLRFLR